MGTSRKLLLIGAGGHSRSCIDVIESEGIYSIVGLVGFKEEIGTSVFGYPIIAADTSLDDLSSEYGFALISVGQIFEVSKRVELFTRATDSGFQLPKVISPFAYGSNRAQIGDGTIVMPGAVVNAGVSIGRNCIINANSIVEHDSIIQDHSHISTGVIVNGGVTVGNQTFVGSGSVLREGIQIGDSCNVGMGISVTRNLPKGTNLKLGESL